MIRPKSFRAVIELWPTRKGLADAVARAWGVNPGADAVSKWWRRDKIPSAWWSGVLATREAKRAGLSSALFAELAACELVEPRP